MRQWRKGGRRLQLVMLILLAGGLIGCAAKKPVYLKGTSEVIFVGPGECVEYSGDWSGAWLISDAALADLMECCE